MIKAFKETPFLSRFVTIKEVVIVFKKHVLYPSKHATRLEITKIESNPMFHFDLLFSPQF